MPDEDPDREETCVNCGSPLELHGPKGGCLRCLLEIAFFADGEPPIKIPPSSEAGAFSRKTYGHFALDLDQDGLPVELGSGAMAATYRAHDTVLHFTVALKVINKDIAWRPAVRERFLSEARAAAKVRHPNIASVSHYGEEDGECYYAMELIEGETLDASVRREGPFSPELALEVGIQVTHALVAAEACGVVHRDLKPSNLMLAAHHGQTARDGGPLTVKVIDWGLAKALNADLILGADQTRDGFVGTPAFASPEQFARCEPLRVDTRSDIYSLGATLWYLLCGCVPSIGGTLDAIYRHQQVLPFEQLAAAGVPRQMVNLLQSMLAFDPANRPRSARELLERLEACKKQVSVRMTRRRARIGWLVFASIILGLFGVGAGAYWHHPRTGTVARHRSVAVLPFKKLGSDPLEAFLTKGMQDEVARSLARVPALHVVNVKSAYYDSLQNHDLPRICRELGATHLLTGSLHRQEGRVFVKVELFNAENAAQVWSAQYDRKPADALLTPGEIAQSVAVRLQVEFPAPVRAAMADPPSSDPDAYDLYLRVRYGRPFFQSENESDDYLRQIVVPSLEAAVARDPKFVLAYCDLGDAYDCLSELDAVTVQAEARAKHRRQAEAALAAARRLRADDGEVHLALARHFYSIVRHHEEARIELGLALDKLPDHVEIEELAGTIACNQSRWDDALRYFKRGAILDPHYLVVGEHLIKLYRYLRRYDDADRVSARMIENMSPKDSVDLRLGRAMGSVEARADLTPLRTILRNITPAEQPQREVMDRFGLVLALCAHNAESLSSLLASTPQTNFRIRGVSYPKAWFVALAARLRHDDTAARAAFAAARSEVGQAVQSDPLNGRFLGLLAMIDAGLGRREEALREALHACELCPVETFGDYAPIVACNLAVVYAWTGQPDAACAVLEQWLQRPAGYNLPNQPSYGDLQLNPLWDSLRDHPGFASLVARLAPSTQH